MSQDSDGTAVELAETASVGQAVEPQGLDQEGAPQAETSRVDTPQDEGGAPTPEELDAREEAMTGPRKSMGPVEEVNPETVPEEA